VERSPVKVGRWRQRQLARSPIVGVMVETVEVKISDFRGFNGHRC
jgi:hypothetical protein